MKATPGRFRRLGMGALAAVGVVAVFSTGAAAAGVRVVAEYPLPPEVRWALDVRWIDDNSVAVTHSHDGTYRVVLAPTAPATLLLPGGGRRPPNASAAGRTSVWAHAYLGISERFVVVAAPGWEFGWLPRQAGGSPSVADFSSIVNVDVHGSRVLLAGLPRAASPEEKGPHAIVWETDLDTQPLSFKPRVFMSRPLPWTALDDWLHASGAVHARFLADGSFVVVPGVEPGVQWYGADGRLLRAWDAEALGLDVVTFSNPKAARQAASSRRDSLELRNSLRLADEILPLPEGPAIVVRQAHGNGVKWTVKHVGGDGSVSSFELPLAVSSRNWVLSGDVRGRRVVVALFEICAGQPRTCGFSRLLELEITP